MTSQVSITVDGFAEEVPLGTTLAQLIYMHKAQHKDLVVELNGRFVHPADWERIQVTPGCRVELIHPMFGG